MSEAELSSRAEMAAFGARDAAAPDPATPAFQLLNESGRYLLASVIALAVDYGVLVALTEWGRLHYLVSAAVSFSLGSVVHYGLSVRLVFRSRRLTNGRAEFASFFAIGLLGLAVTQAVLWVCVSRIDLDYRLAKMAATAISFTLNFVVRKALLFTRQAPSR